MKKLSENSGTQQGEGRNFLIDREDLAKEAARKILAEKSGINISWDSLACKVSGYGLDDWGSIPADPNWLWGLPSLYQIGAYI